MCIHNGWLEFIFVAQVISAAAQCADSIYIDRICIGRTDLLTATVDRLRGLAAGWDRAYSWTGRFGAGLRVFGND